MLEYNPIKEFDESQVIVCKDWNDMMGKDFYGEYAKEEGDQSKPTIYYAKGRLNKEVRSFVLQKDLDIYKELAEAARLEALRKAKEEKKRKKAEAEAAENEEKKESE
jgi:hypothetical protein